MNEAKTTQFNNTMVERRLNLVALLKTELDKPLLRVLEEATGGSFDLSDQELLEALQS
jgi:hypothetical protein